MMNDGSSIGVRGSVAMVAMVAMFAMGCSIAIDAQGDGFGDSGPVTGTYAPLVAAPAPPIDSHCSPAPSLVTGAICVCNTLSLAGSLRTYGRPGEPADVGVGGDVDLASGTVIDGSLRAAGEVSSAGSLRVAHHLWAGRGVDAAGSLRVGGDLASGGAVDGAGSLDVRGELRVAGAEDWAGSRRVGGRGTYTTPQAAPCGCDSASIYDVAKAVEVARSKNDNAPAHVDPHLTNIGSSELVLSSGRYYLASLASVGNIRIRVEGEVQLYVDGDLDVVGSSRLTLGRGAALDLFVAGSVHTVGSVHFGDDARPDAFRLYVGGGGDIELVGSQDWSGVLYAPTADVKLTGSTEIHGAIVARSLDKAGSLVVRAARATSYGTRCEAKPVVNPPAANPTPGPVPPPCTDPAPDAGSPAN